MEVSVDSMIEKPFCSGNYDEKLEIAKAKKPTPKLNILSSKLKNRPLAQLQSARYRCGRSGVRPPGRSNRHSVANDSPPLRRFFGAV